MPDPIVPGAPPAPPEWAKTASPEALAHMQVKGVDLTDPGKVALAFVDMHRNAEGKLGVPADQLIRWPKDASDEANWTVLRERLGIPKDAKDYDFGIAKGTDGKSTNQALDDALRTFASTNKLPKEAATALGAQVQKLFADQQTTAKAVLTEQLNVGRAALAKEWGTTADKLQESPSMVVAKNTAAALGITPEALNALEGTVGYKDTMQLLYKIGTKIGEDKFITNTGPGGNKNAMTPAQAKEELTLLKKDPQWSARYLAGGFEEGKKMTALLSIIGQG